MDKVPRAGGVEANPVVAPPPVSEGARGVIEKEPLPELELVVIQRSKSPVNLVEKRIDKIEKIIPWKNYTLVTLEGSEVIKIFDDEADQITDFTGRQARKYFDFNWTSKIIQKKVGKRYLSKDGYQSTEARKISELPQELRGLARGLIGNRDAVDLANQVQFKTVTRQVVVLDPYVVFAGEDSGFYFAFKTVNEDGIVLAPRDWTRIELEQEVFPGDLDQMVQEALQSRGRYRPINKKYSIVVTDVGVNIVERNTGNKKPVFADTTPSVERNTAVDPINPNILYYCQGNNPRDIKRLDLSAESSAWQVVEAELPKKYESIKNLQLDPSGQFFLFYSKEDLVIITKDGLEEVKRVPGLSQVNFDAAGRIRAVDKDGHLVIYEPGFAAVAEKIEKHRVQRLAQGLQMADVFDLASIKRVEVDPSGEQLEHLRSLREKYVEQSRGIIEQLTTLEELKRLRLSLEKLRGLLAGQGLKPHETLYIIAGIEPLVQAKEKGFAVLEVRRVLIFVRGRLGSGLSVGTLTEVKAEMEKIKSMDVFLDEDLRKKYREVVAEVEQKSRTFFQQRGGEMVRDIQGLVERTRTDLEGYTSKVQMDEWLEFRYPQLKARLGSLAKDVPMEADDSYKAIMAARADLQTLATTYEEKFKREYAKVREKAVERTEAVVDTLVQDVDGLLERLKAKAFTDRHAAEQYLATSEARKSLEQEIAGLAGDNPDVAKELNRILKVKLSNALTEVERGALTKVVETGQQMVMFGKTAFPKWEAKVKGHVERKVDLTFEEDVKTHGAGVRAFDILGDVSMAIRASDGEVQKVRLYEGWQDESEWRLGLLTHLGVPLPPSYVSAKDFRDIRRDYTDWSKGERSALKKELAEKREAMKDIYARWKKTPGGDAALKEEYSKKLAEYAAFSAKHHVSILRRVDHVRTEPEIEHTNGKGFVPEWQSHWVADAQTEADLEDMAKALKMQLDLQEGLLNLKGHAGTGKDVRIKMFCALTNRPYFGIDGTKWTTEFELSEDVMLESKDGASQTIRVPSAVLNGITTPGAVVYFNEFNAMPEQAQIFLHALMDEKRSLTLKTSSGKTIRALPSVVLVGSMNPDYPGTFHPQFATRSRMVSLEIGYPPLTRPPAKGDRNQNPLFDSSEALRLARGIDSLDELTYEASLERNEFVKMWDKYVNGLTNGALEPTTTQKFDIDVCLALIQFANTLRDNFIKIFEKTRDSRNALPVSQPITGRELRRCAYALNTMTPAEKTTANPEGVARQLLERFFLTHIDKKEDQDKIRTAMATWSSKKRVKA